MGTTAREPMERGESEEEEDEELGEEATPDQQRCRICAGEASAAAAAARIFGEEGRKRNLQRSIQKYLHIAVSFKDKLPKMICASCIDKLDDIHAFATMAMRSQERLRQELLRATSNSAVTVDSSNSSDSSVNKLGDRGLLHSILTKGSIETSNEEELLQRRQRTPSTEEMEVKVDPMLFLQCALEQSSSVDYSDFSDESDVEINSEPLSLTKKKIDTNEEKYVPTTDMRKNCDDNDNENVDNVTNCKSNMSDIEDEEFEEGEELSTAKQKAHMCKICAKAFASQIALQNHLWSHLPTTTSTMNMNDCTDNDSTELHAQRFFDGVNGVISQNNSCAENNLLNGHFICPICGKKISTKGNLKVHLETHRPKGKYGCDICGRIFKTQSNLFRHKEYHSGIQFPCVVCGRVYPTNSTLRAHSITHSDLRPHACPLCDKTFKRNQDLKFHINQHTGARPYQCPYCPKAFASSGNCFSHRKRMHPKEVHRDRQRAADLMR